MFTTDHSKIKKTLECLKLSKNKFSFNITYFVITNFITNLHLGLKVMMVCFEKNLSQDWHRVLHCLKDMDTRGEGGIALWDFLDFVVSFRTPLFIQMRPFILTKV